MTIIIIECKVFEWDYCDEYEVEIDRDAPRCCGDEMTFCCHDYHLEIWQCSQCGDVESFYPGMYGSDFITMNRQEYEDYEASKRQRERLLQRYSTDHPPTIRDYWQITSDKRSSRR